MVLWFVLPSVLCLMVVALSDDVVQPQLCVVCQLPQIDDLWAHVVTNVKEVDAGQVEGGQVIARPVPSSKYPPCTSAGVLPWESLRTR